VLVERDTLSELYLFEQLKARNVFVQLSAKTFRLTRGNPDIMSERSMAERIVLQAKRIGIQCKAEELLNMPLIMSTMRAEIMRQADCRLHTMLFTYRYDDYVLAALRAEKLSTMIQEK
jgi:hypothetical protein